MDESVQLAFCPCKAFRKNSVQYAWLQMFSWLSCLVVGKEHFVCSLQRCRYAFTLCDVVWEAFFICSVQICERFPPFRWYGKDFCSVHTRTVFFPFPVRWYGPPRVDVMVAMLKKPEDCARSLSTPLG